MNMIIGCILVLLPVFTFILLLVNSFARTKELDREIERLLAEIEKEKERQKRIERESERTLKAIDRAAKRVSENMREPERSQTTKPFLKKQKF